MTPMPTDERQRARHAERVLDSADCLYEDARVRSALGVMALQINRHYADAQEPVIVMAILNGGLACAGQLLCSLTPAVEVDYVHATRYRNNRPGETLQWIKRPSLALAGRRVLLIDDILDEGTTLKAVRDECLALGAREVVSAVLVRKERAAAPAIEADFWALAVPDRYVFGWGMDCDGLLRNAPGIFALP